MKPSRAEIQIEIDFWDQAYREELDALWQRACKRAGRQINPAAENMEHWLDQDEIAAYRMIFPPANRACETIT